MQYINDDFLLSTDAARELYHRHAESLPIIDYHCHLEPSQIAQNIQFRDLTQLWLVDGLLGDHYKWRAMRANGVGEQYITGTEAGPREKFLKWAQTMPYLMRNPLYHWSHLELARVFGIHEILSPASADEIYSRCNEMLATEAFRGQALIRRFSVETLCTTDDPADSLEHHKQIAENPFGTKVLPAWRPDNAMQIESPSYKAYLERLGEAAGIEIRSYRDLSLALQRRHDFFADSGCRLSDHGIDTFYAEDYTESEIEAIFAKVLRGGIPDSRELAKFRSCFLYDQGVMDAAAGWVQQYHVGPLRNCNSRMFASIGANTGFDSIGDLPVAASGHRFLDNLCRGGNLAKTILYCINPKDYEVMASMACTFNEGPCPGKIQLGAAWWFLDQENGIRRQLDALSSLGLLSRFVGMLTDSRSFISYPRHEYFRRILCDILGSDIESGRLPADQMDFIGSMVEDISYRNAKNYFNF